METKLLNSLKGKGKDGFAAAIAIFFLIQMNAKMDDQATKIEAIKENQRELLTTQKQLRTEVTNLWLKYNQAIDSKEALSKEGSAAYLKLIERINKLENKIE